MKFFILTVSILTILNLGQAQERLSPGVYKQFEFQRSKNSSTIRTFNLDPIDLQNIDSLEISGQVFLRGLPLYLQIYTLGSDGKKKFYTYNSEVDPKYPMYSDSSAVRIIELIKQINLKYEDVEEKTPFCDLGQKTCTIKIDIILSELDHAQLPVNDTNTGSLIYSIQYKTNSSYLEYGPFFPNQKDALDLKTTSLAYSWVMADGDRQKLMLYKLVTSITKQNKHFYFNLLQTQIAQDSFVIKVQQQQGPCSPEQQPCTDWVWPTLTEKEENSLRNQIDNNFAHSYLGICKETACHFAVSVYIKSKMQRDNGFYIDIPSETDFPKINFKEGVPTITNYSFNILSNDLFRYHYLQFEKGGFDDKQLSIAVRGDHFKELQYEVVRFDNKSNLIGKYQNDEFAMLNPIPDVKYIIFTYGDPKITVNVELSVNFMPIKSLMINSMDQDVKTSITFHSDIKDYFRKQGNIFKIFKIKNGLVDKVNFKFELEKTESSPDTNLDYVSFYVNHCKQRSEAAFPQNNLVDKIWTGLTINNQTSVNNKIYNCGQDCLLLLRLENKNTHNTTINIITSYHEIEDPNKDNGKKGGLGPGGIVGIVLGSIIGVSLLGFFGLRYYRKKKTEADAYKNMEYNNDLEEIDENNNETTNN